MTSYHCFAEGAHLSTEIPVDEFVIGHGASRFMQPQRVADLKRKNKTGGVPGCLAHWFDNYLNLLAMS